MSKLSKIQTHSDNGLSFRCPGCNITHRIQYGTGDGPRWSWNGDFETPTFLPSVSVRGIREDLTDAEWDQYEVDYSNGGSEAVLSGRFATRCHSFVTDGRIQFLGDCTHELAGQTVDLPEWG